MFISDVLTVDDLLNEYVRVAQNSPTNEPPQPLLNSKPTEHFCAAQQ